MVILSRLVFIKNLFVLSLMFIRKAWNNVHAPNEAPDNYLNMHNNIQDPNRRGMAGMVSALDDAFQAIVDKLKEKGMCVTNHFTVCDIVDSKKVLQAPIQLLILFLLMNMAQSRKGMKTH